MTLDKRYPALADLMASGFHQDFWDLYGSPEAVVSSFTDDPIFCARLPLEVDSLLGRFDEDDREDRLDAVLDELDNNYDYFDDDLTPSTWLTRLRAQVLAETPEVETVHSLTGASVVGVSGGDVLVLQVDRAAVRYPGGVLVQGPAGRGAFAPGRGAEAVEPAIGERILLAHVVGDQLRLATPTVQVVSDVESPAPHWEVVS